MPKVKISEYSATANSNTDVASINIDEGCAPSGINNAIRAIMGHLKDFQSGTNGDPFNGPVNGTVGATTPSTGAFTTLSASSTVTLSGGTANGVAYLNGSKVLTTGSALVFDGTNLGIGESLPAYKLVVSGTAPRIVSQDTTNSKIAVLRCGDTVGYVGTESNIPFLVLANSNTILNCSTTGAVGLYGAATNATGVGITFPATQSASSDANTLDDYEEGTFTPSAVGSTTAGTGTYSTRTGVYTKIGRFVHVSIAIDWSAHTGTGNLRISGLPFSAIQNEVANMFVNGLTYTGTHLQPFLVGTEIWLNQTSSGASDSYVPMDTSCQLFFTVVYYV